MKSRKGSVLVAVLWCLALLSVIVVSVLYTARIDLKATKNYGDSIQAYYLALAGVEKAKALIYHDAAARKRAGQNHSGELYNDPADFRDVTLGRGKFRVLRAARSDEGGKLAYGISDEESRLNVNSASIEELMKLYGMRPEMAASIVDWRDRDDNASPGGAEAEYYGSLRPPYVPRNDRIQTARELLMVAAVTPELLFGEDANANGLLDPEENDSDRSFPPDNRDGVLDAGWSASLCFESSVRNRNAAAQNRVDLNSADEATLAGIPGITPEIARAIVEWRNQNRFESIAGLLEVKALAPANPQQAAEQQRQQQEQQAQQQDGQNPAPAQPQRQPTGPNLVSEDLFLQIADDVTIVGQTTQRGLININTASGAVLMCLPQMTEELAQAIVNHRSSAGYLANIGDLLRVPGMTREIFKQLAPKVTARSETFRIISEGKVASSGARRRMEVIVQLGNNAIDTLSYRENL